MMTVLPTPAPPNRPDFTATQIRFDQIDDLNSRLKHFEIRILIDQRRSQLVDRGPAVLR
jgi:hypothetical protein